MSDASIIKLSLKPPDGLTELVLDHPSYTAGHSVNLYAVLLIPQARVMFGGF
jgi:hypothetical protein